MQATRIPQIAALTLLGALLPACGVGERSAASRAEMSRAVSAAEVLEVHLPQSIQGDDAGPQPLHRRVELAARTLSERRGVEVRVLEGEAQGDPRAPRLVFGKSSDAKVRALLVAGGAQLVGEDGVNWQGFELGRAGDVLLACFEDPERPGLPLNLFVAQRLRDLGAVCDDLTVCTRPGLRLARKAEAVREAALTGEVDGTPSTQWSNWHEVRKAESFVVRRSSRVLEEQAARYAGELADSFAHLDRWVGAGSRGFQEVFLVASGERQRALAGEAGQFAAASSSGRGFVLLGEGMRGDHGASVAARAARAALGEPQAAWMLDGAGIDAAGRWWGRELRGWGQRLAFLGLLPGVEEITSAASIDRYSQHILAPLRGLLWRHVLETRGEQALRELWRGEVELHHSDEDFRVWLLGHDGGVIPLPSRSRQERLEELQFWRGIVLASDAQPGGGFDTAELGTSLQGAIQVTVNSVSVTSFYAERVPEDRTPGGQLAHGRECLEGDSALAQALATARVRGAVVIALRPQLLLSESTGYSNYLRRTTVEHWQEFFAAFHSMTTHYALLAELCGVDLLVLGSDLSVPLAAEGLSEEARELRSAALGSVLRHARACFDGALSYALSWPLEVHDFEHWDELDYVGVSWFPGGRSSNPEPRDEVALRADWMQQLASMAAIADEAGKPWMIVEFGVRATDGGAGDTHLGFGAENSEQQQLAVRALARALAGLARSERAPRGLFWWNWSATGEAEERGYSLHDLPTRDGLYRLGRDL